VLLGIVGLLARAPDGQLLANAGLCLHFLVIWLWCWAFAVIARHYRAQQESGNSEVVTVLFLLKMLAVTLLLASVHGGLVAASDGGLRLGNRVFLVGAYPPLAHSLPQVFIGLAALILVVSMRRSAISSLIDESNAARVIRHLNATLEVERQKLQSVVSSIRAGMAIVDQDGVILWANEIYTELFGRGAPLTGQDSRTVLGVSGTGSWLHRELRESGKASLQTELTLTSADGTKRPFLLSAYTLQEPDGGVSRHLQLLQDLSEQKSLQARLLQQEKLASAGQLIGGVAHELNNPLSVVLGQAELAIGEGPLSEPLRESIEAIQRNSLRCHKIVKNLLSFVRKYQPEKVLGSLLEPVQAVAELKRYQLRADRIELVLEVPETLPDTMLDQHQLQQVFLNLVNNAHDAIAELRRPGRIGISLRQEDGWLVVTISDDGPGVPEILRAKIMSPFFTTKPPGRGTGLGLAICKGIVEEHGGTFELLAELGAGAAFRLRLPIVGGGVTRPTREPGFEQTGGGRILIIDDDVEVLKTTSRMLRDGGYICETEANAAPGLRRLLAGENFDLVLCDLKMPDVDGFAFRDRLHQALATPPPLLFLSGDTANPLTREQLEARGAGLIEKPFTQRELLSQIGQAIPRVRAS
jgi:two-component system NtrC family sensor kinase